MQDLFCARSSIQESTLRTENPFLPGKTFPFPCRPISPLQPYEGEFIIQNRTGASIRLGTGTSNNSQYSKKPQHHKDTKKGDPTFAMTLERPGSPKLRPINDKSSTIDFNKSQSDKRKSQTYRIENLSNNLTGIFAGIEAIEYVLMMVMQGVALPQAIILRAIGVALHFSLTFIQKNLGEFLDRGDPENRSWIPYLVAVGIHSLWNTMATTL